ncbi:YggL family protein [Vogesella sp. GCM10023246]|uniref:YggL family protein n=1 Tax=Vogesella oryzagri TaxID=3160864 RepID=A0ABV1M5V6_9NEIS
MTNANSRNRLKRLNSRQRKKLRVGEFQELGFTVVATLSCDEAASDAFLNDWLEAVDAQGVSFGGHYNQGELDGIVFPVGAATITAELRSALVAWLQGRKEITQLQAGELMDVWHSHW